MKKVKFKNNDEREAIINEYVGLKGYVAIGEENHFDGKCILFGPPSKYHVETNKGWGVDGDSWLDNEVRYYRDYLLLQSDFSQLDDVREIQLIKERNAWRKYRKELRDLTEKLTPTGVDYKQIEWPERPDGKDTLEILAVAEKQKILMGI